MLVNGFLLGLITFIGWSFAFTQMPVRMQGFFANHNFLTDTIVIMGTYTVLGSQIVSLFAAAFVGLFFEIFTYILRNRAEFQWLFTYIDNAKVQAREMISNLKAQGEVAHGKDQA